MSRKGLVVGTVSILIVVFVYWGTSFGAKDCGGIPAEKVADMVQAVIESNRTFYTVHVVERMQAKGVVVASENWKTEKTLPLPAQFLKESARLAVNTEAKIGYKLIGLWPINKQNGPQNEYENKGLVETLQNPDRPYTEVIKRGGIRFSKTVRISKPFMPTELFRRPASAAITHTRTVRNRTSSRMT